MPDLTLKWLVWTFYNLRIRLKGWRQSWSCSTSWSAERRSPHSVETFREILRFVMRMEMYCQSTLQMAVVFSFVCLFVPDSWQPWWILGAGAGKPVVCHWNEAWAFTGPGEQADADGNTGNFLLISLIWGQISARFNMHFSKADSYIFTFGPLS